MTSGGAGPILVRMKMTRRCLRLVALLLAASLLLSGLALAGLVPAALAATAAARELGGKADPPAGCWLGHRPARCSAPPTARSWPCCMATRTGSRSASKDSILAAYLNQVYVGEGVYGIATAAEHYFAVPVGRLSLAQAAALAGAIASPERFRPTAGRTARPAATWSWTGWRRSASPARPGSRGQAGCHPRPRSSAMRSASAAAHSPRRTQSSRIAARLRRNATAPR